MIEYFFARQQGVLMARVTGVYDIEAMASLDSFVAKFVAANGPVRALYDFSEVEQVTVPESRMAERARQPSIAGGQRVMVAPRATGLSQARAYSEQQSDAGQPVIGVVAKLEEAYVLLGLNYDAKFEPVRSV